jgi:hypothetical protein
MTKKPLSEIIPDRANRLHEEKALNKTATSDYGVLVINKDWSPDDKASALSNFCEQLLAVEDGDVSLFALWVDRGN